MKIPLDLIETRLRSWIESSTNLFPWSNRQAQLARQLVQAMQEAITSDENDEVLTAPNVYTVYLEPGSALISKDANGTVEKLTRVLMDCAHEADIRFATQPILIQFKPLAGLQKDEIRIITATSPLSPGESPLMATRAVHLAEEDIPQPPNAYLIVNGAETFLLRQSVINIGRRADNHLVIDDPRVSRVHAQLRLAQNRYILFDLNSTGGTYVNGQRVTQYSMKPGDVISMAGVPLIYGEESVSEAGDTGKLEDLG